MLQLTLKFNFFQLLQIQLKNQQFHAVAIKILHKKKINKINYTNFILSIYHKLLDLFFSILTLKVKHLIFFKIFHPTMLVVEKRLIKSFIQIHESNTYGSGPQTISRNNPHYA